VRRVGKGRSTLKTKEKNASSNKEENRDHGFNLVNEEEKGVVINEGF